MRVKILAAVALLAVGVGAVGLAVVGPSLGANSSVKYLTAQATRTTVTKTAVATGTVVANAVYGLGFGRGPVIVSNAASASSSSSSSGSSSSNSSAGGGSSSWTTTAVKVAIGDKVTKGELLATADPTNADASLASAQAALASAQARLATDQAGPTAITIASAQDGVTQAQMQLTNAQQSLTQTEAQNQLAVEQAQAQLTSAQQKLSTDQAASAPAATISADEAAVSSAQLNLTSAQQKATASNQQAQNAVNSASFGVTVAQHNYEAKLAPATPAQIASDEAAVATAQAQVATAQQTVTEAKIVAPADGTVSAVNVIAGVAAPSGDAIEVEIGPMYVTAAFAESDIPSLQAGQAATVSITATSQTADGTVASITPIASSSGTSSVVSYTVLVALVDAPAGIQSGMSANVTVTTASASNVIAVPTTAVVGRAGSYTVRTMDSNGQITSHDVTVGLATTSLTEIQSGINVGDTVVVGTSTTRTSSSTSTGANIGGLGGLGGGTGGRFVNGGGVVTGGQ